MQHLCGYVYDEKAIEQFIAESPMYCQMGDLASGKGKDFFLFDIERQLTGRVRLNPYQRLGDCVSHGAVGGAEDVQFVQMANAPGFEFKDLSSEYMYGVARIQVGQGGCGYGDGAVVAWALDGMRKYGLLPRARYGDYDLSQYNPALAKRWGTPRIGAPQELVEIAKSHLVLKAQLLQGSNLYEQSRDVLFNGGSIITGSNQLFSSVRDRQGFCRPEGRGGHCTRYRGFTDAPKRPGIVYQQQWGPDIPSGGATTVTLESGREVELPPGSFFIDAEVYDGMHRGGGNEVWALWSANGFLKPDAQVKFVFA